MRRRLAGVIFVTPLSLSTNTGAVADNAVPRLEGTDFSGLEEVAAAFLSEGISSKVMAGVLGTVVGPLQGGSSSSSLGTGEFGRLERWGELRALFKELEGCTIQRQTTRRGVDRKEEGTPQLSWRSYIPIAPLSVAEALGMATTRDACVRQEVTARSSARRCRASAAPIAPSKREE